MTLILALSGPDLPDVDLIAGSAFWVALIIGGLGIFLPYRVAVAAGGLAAFIGSIGVWGLFLLKDSREDFWWEMPKAVLLLVVASALLFFKRSPKH